MIRKILALLVGIIATSVVVGLVQQLGHYLFPLPVGTDPNDPEAIKKYVETAPFMAIFFVIISYSVGAFTGGFVSTKIANNGKKIYAIIIGILFLMTSIYMMIIIPSPIWFWILGIAVWTLVLVGYKLALNKNEYTNH
ncbi:hypothetical protein Q73A0000_04280 [Kaistella flava (ex Peng et al. 2021)]|uniref:Uncharacterized protein n=1 Tax=Kaistella flava (ex Peng et al. 2021) TaxID=2038776 RepID=A0A7M2Y5X4_9FLAO|nr:hypothetical protein [Kaistella flava (ex Peng et al. 2021)]QOW09638.1 hypothetical protein Q73A0000_04280 [Kaistella flava (ex Peng et al. 2021)]